MLVDIGANLAGGKFSKDFGKVVERSYAASVEKIIITGTDMPASRRALSLITDYNTRHPVDSSCCKLYSTAGIHPHSAITFEGDKTLDELKAMIEHDSVVAVGECGLDYDRMYSPKADQLRCFNEHLQLERYFREVRGLKKPLFLHDRAAHEDFVEMLRANRPQGVVHCFTGNREQVERYVELDMYIGITGWICDERRNRDLVVALPCIPLNRLLVETDAPYLQPNKSIKRNEPQYLPLVVDKIASLLGVSTEVIAEQTTRNAAELFDI